MVNNKWYRNGRGKENHRGHRSFSYRCSAGRKNCQGRLCIWTDRNNTVIDKRITAVCSESLDHPLLYENLNEVIVGQQWNQVPVFRRRSPAREREPENSQQEEGMVNREEPQEQVIEQRVEEEEIQIQLFRCPICDLHKTEWVTHGCLHVSCSAKESRINHIAREVTTRRERIFLETYSACFFCREVKKYEEIVFLTHLSDKQIRASNIEIDYVRA